MEDQYQPPVICGRFDVWVLIRSEQESRFWVQQPPAVIDPKSNTSQAKVAFGDAQHPWSNGRRWDILAIAAPSKIDMGHKLFEPTLKSLPTHVSSKVVITVVATDR